MAGNYPDVPSWRVAYDRDGSQLFWSYDAVTWTQLTETNMRELNDEDTVAVVGVGTSETKWLGLLFPAAMDIDAMAIGVGGIGNGSAASVDQLQWSADTTNLTDGTWTGITTPAASFSKTTMRNNIQGYSLLSAKGVRARISNGSTNNRYFDWWHIYGEYSAGENPDRLEIVQVGQEARVLPAHFDFGDRPRSTSTTKQFRVKNLSATLTAQQIIVAFEVLLDTTPSVDGQHTVSADQSSYIAQVNIGDLAPGAVSPTMDLRQVLASNAVLGLWWGRVTADAGSWV